MFHLLDIINPDNVPDAVGGGLDINKTDFSIGLIIGLIIGILVTALVAVFIYDIKSTKQDLKQSEEDKENQHPEDKAEPN